MYRTSGHGKTFHHTAHRDRYSAATRARTALLAAQALGNIHDFDRDLTARDVPHLIPRPISLRDAQAVADELNKIRLWFGHISVATVTWGMANALRYEANELLGGQS
jgi:hypothetical protein